MSTVCVCVYTMLQDSVVRSTDDSKSDGIDTNDSVMQDASYVAMSIEKSVYRGVGLVELHVTQHRA